MARLARLTHRDPARAVTARLKQFFVLILSAIIGILVSVSVNAQRPTKTVQEYADPCAVLAKKRMQKPVKRGFRLVSKTKKRELPGRAETASNTTPVINQLPAASLVQQHIIREMVATHLKEQHNNRPIELAPLQFYPAGGKLAVQDVNPFLIATEFGLQGKTIQIRNTASEQHDLAKHIRQLMHQLGVPAERISIIEAPETADTGLSNGKVHSVAFQVL